MSVEAITWAHGKSAVGEELKMKAKAIAVQGSEIMDGLTNWESSQTSDGDRFIEGSNGVNGKKSLKNFETYLKRKEIRKAAKKAQKSKKIFTQKDI